MFVFHSTFDLAGAGPAENREKAESLWNCGHSYWFKLPLMVELPLTCAFTELPGAACRETDAKTADETSRRTKTAPTLKVLIIVSSPKRYDTFFG
jgi:hypothetical protein